MPFEKGHKLGKGRPKGSKNKSSEEIRELFQDILISNKEQIKKHIEAINSSGDPFEAMTILLKLCSFIIPKLTSTNLTSDEGNNINIIIPSNPKDKEDNINE